MNRRTLLKSAFAAGLFAMVGSLAACGANQINRVLAALRALPPFIRSFALGSEVTERILQAVSQISASFQIFVDDSTRGNLRKTLAVINKLLEDGLFDTGNATTTQRLKAAIALAVFIIETINIPAPPLPAGVMFAPDRDMKVSVSKEQEEKIEPKLDELEQMLGIKK